MSQPSRGLPAAEALPSKPPVVDLTALLGQLSKLGLDFAAAHDLYVLSDEIYETLVYDGGRHVSPATLSRAARGRTSAIVVRGRRPGPGAGPGPDPHVGGEPRRGRLPTPRGDDAPDAVDFAHVYRREAGTARGRRRTPPPIPTRRSSGTYWLRRHRCRRGSTKARQPPARRCRSRARERRTS